MELDFTSVLSRAWKITWNYKILWLFGILASCGQGGGNPTGTSNYQFDQGEFENFNFDLPRPLLDFFDGLQEGDPRAIGLVVGVVCLLFLISLAAYALSIIGRGGLIGGVRLAAANNALTFGEAWQEGLKHFINLFLIGLITGLAGLVVGLITIGPGVLVAIATAGIGVLCLLPLICVFALFAILLSILSYFAQIAAVVEGLGVVDALRRAWELLRGKLVSIFVLGVLLAVIGGIASVIISLPLLFTVFPAVIGIIGFGSDNQAMGTGALTVAAICFVAYLPVLLVAGGILHTWITASWTLAYQDLTGKSSRQLAVGSSQ